MTDAELLEQVQMGRAWINKSRRRRWSWGLLWYFLKQESPWPVAVDYLDTLLTRLESLLEEKLEK